jgi:large subunit ribosomal protein L29e
MQANNGRAVSACTEVIKALVKPQAIKPKMSRCPSRKLSAWLLLLTPSLGSGFESTWPRRKGSANWSPRFNPRQRPQLQLRPSFSSSSGSQRCPGPCEGPIGKAAANVKTDGLLGHTCLHTICRWPVPYVVTNELEARSVLKSICIMHRHFEEGSV